MSPEKPITPPEKFVAFNGVVYEIIPGSEDFPERKRPLVARTIRAMAWVDGLRQLGVLACLPLPPVTSPKRKPSSGTTPLQFIRRFARKEPSSFCLFDVSLVISSVGDLLPACGPR